MFVVVAYDIQDDRRRSRVLAVLEEYGLRVQWSVFECCLDRRAFRTLRDQLEPLVEDARDSIRFYMVCSTCLRQCQHRGGVPFSRDPLYFMA